MNQDQYNLTSACILTVAGLNRVVNDLDFIIGSYGLPMDLDCSSKNKSNPYTHSFLNLPEHENGGSL